MQPINTILVAVDLGHHTADVLHAAVMHAKAHGAALVVTHCVHELRAMYGAYVGAGSVHALQEEVEADAHEKLQAFFDEDVAPHGIEARHVVLKGMPWTEIIGCAIREDAGMIVVGLHVADKPEHRVLGRTADRVLRHASCPVLVVPPQPPE
ncbi:MAG: universal stress protein [Planctomycetota bacterium]